MPERRTSGCRPTTYPREWVSSGYGSRSEDDSSAGLEACDTRGGAPPPNQRRRKRGDGDDPPGGGKCRRDLDVDVDSALKRVTPLPRDHDVPRSRDERVYLIYRSRGLMMVFERHDVP